MYKVFKYRLYPTRRQQTAMRQMLETHRHLYNRALAERKEAWDQERRTVRYEAQSAHLKGDRQTNPYLAQTNFSSCQATLRRLDNAFEDFFRRVKAGKTPGYPRFKGRGRFDTVIFPAYRDGCKIEGNRVYFQHIGKIRIVLHRPIEGRIKTLSFTRHADTWYVIAVCERENVTPAPHPGPAVGIDVGLEKFVYRRDDPQSALLPPGPKSVGAGAATIEQGSQGHAGAGTPQAECAQDSRSDRQSSR
jgi:putative transposase